MSEPTRSRIDFLDCLRIFAFLTVLVGHRLFAPLTAIAEDPAVHVTLRWAALLVIPLCYEGLTGVVVFFLISGYIITHVLQSESPAEFMIKRIFRIYPLYIFAVFSEQVVALLLNQIPIPPLSVWIPRLLLLGDFFDTKYSLNGVEWTLRVEILFYLFMATLKSMGVLRKAAVLPLVFLLCTALLDLAKPFPSHTDWTVGNLNLYGPFLFVGALIYLAEQKLAATGQCIISVALIFVAYLILTPKIQPRWSDTHAAFLALGIFLGAWWWRRQMPGGRVVTALSSLTYAVYLFHNWLWPHLEKLVAHVANTVTPSNATVFLMLIVICHLLHHTVERYGVAVGRRLVARFRGRHPSRQLHVHASDS